MTCEPETPSLWIGNDNLLTLSGLTNELTDQPINNAVVQVWLLDTAGAEVQPIVWPIQMQYVAGSDGDYSATLPDTLQLVQGRDYFVRGVADGGPGLLGRAEMRVTARLRGQL